MKFLSLRYLLIISILSIIAVSCNDDESTPITDPLEEAFENGESWYWIAKDEMKSRSGLSSGYGVNFNSNSTKLVIYLEGGGACFNAVTCFGNPDKFTEAEFNQLLNTSAGNGDIGMFSRSSTQNPFSDWNFIYIPYSTGDIHAGNNPSSDVPGGLNNQQMVGFNNVTEVLNDISPFFIDKGITEVFLSGSSAGGYGALINYDQVAESFPDLNISMIADSSPVFFSTELFPECFNERLESTFNIQFPSDYSNFTGDSYPYNAQRVYEYLSNKYPDAQFGFFSYFTDETEEYFYGFGADDCADAVNPISDEEFQSGLLDMADKLEELGNWRVYYETGSAHTILFSDSFETLSVSGVPFTTWLSQLNQKTAGNVMSQ